jgi:hypothetical protein
MPKPAEARRSGLCATAPFAGLLPWCDLQAWRPATLNTKAIKKRARAEKHKKPLVLPIGRGDAARRAVPWLTVKETNLICPSAGAAPSPASHDRSPA